MKKAKIKATDFDRKFDAGEDVGAHLDWSKARVVRPKLRRIQVSLPEPLAKSLAAEAVRRGVKLQTLITQCLSDQLAKAV
ncbi:MAG: type II toxin-antitoxin system BrnA family antitoxin [Limisphaerales bacterium]